jgi:hypothetical protein
MARFATRRLGTELLRMRIFVASIAVPGRFRKSDMQHRALQVWRPMALDATHSPVRSHQREVRRVVIEAAHVMPVSCGVARFAPGLLTGARARLHAIRELATVYIFVARGAFQRRKMEPRGF